MGTQEVENRRIKAVNRVFEIVKIIRRNNGPTMTEIADRVDLSKSTVHTYLKTIEEEGFVVVEDGQYSTSLQFLDYGVHARNDIEVYDFATDPISQLAAETNEAVWLIVEERGFAVSIAKAIGDRGIQTRSRLGRHAYLHQHAGGKAILSRLSETEIRSIIDRHGLPQATENTITDVEKLFERIEQYREQGYAVGHGEAIRGANTIASPIVSGGEPLGSVVIVGPRNRLTERYLEEKLRQPLQATTNEIELLFDHA